MSSPQDCSWWDFYTNLDKTDILQHVVDIFSAVEGNEKQLCNQNQWGRDCREGEVLEIVFSSSKKCSPLKQLYFNVHTLNKLLSRTNVDTIDKLRYETLLPKLLSTHNRPQNNHSNSNSYSFKLINLFLVNIEQETSCSM